MDDKKLFGIFGAIALFVVVLWLGWPAILNRMPTTDPKDSIAEKGQYGDSFGALNTLFTGLAFIGVALGITLQIREVRKREEEVKSEGKAKAFEKFEDHFFQLNQIYRATSDAVRLNIPGGGQYCGKEAFTRLLLGVGEPNFLELFNRYFNDNADFLIPYIRVLQSVFDHIDRADISEPLKMEFAHLVVAQMSHAEVIFLGYFGLRPAQHFKRLIEKYHLLELAQGHHRKFLEPQYILEAFEPPKLSVYGFDQGEPEIKR